VKDPELEAFVEALEQRLSQLRGQPHTLSPREFELARGWFASGAGVAVVLRGIEQAFAREPTASSLVFCDRFVDVALAGARDQQPGREPPPALDTPEDVAGRVSALVRGLERQAAIAAFERPLRKLREIEDLLAVAPRPNWAYVGDLLEEIEEQISRAALEALSPAEREALSAEAERAVDRQRGRVAEPALASARRRQLLRRAREHFGLPGLRV
jgi:hypothetical protein